MSRSLSPGEARRAVEEAAAKVRTTDFWEARQGLRLIRDWARARRAAPYAVAGEVVAGVIGRIPPAVQLPALVGGPGSLNLLVASVGPSGEGKGAAAACRVAAVDWSGRYVDMVLLGTGEGLERTFGTGRKDKSLGYITERTRYRALFVAHEVDQLAALMARKGATLSPTLRSAWSGESLGHGNADPERRVIIEAHQYRAIGMVGVQPGRGEALLGDADGGLPQRFLWLPTTDPDIPDDKPDDPARILWKPPSEIEGLADHDLSRARVMPVCEIAAAAIDQARVARMRGDGDALDGHALYTRLKVAAGLALFAGRFEVNAEDWELAGHLMAVSDRTRERIAQALRMAQEARNNARGQAEATRAQIVSSTTEAVLIAEVGRRIRKVLAESGDWMPRGQLRLQVTQRRRMYFDDAVEALIERGEIEAKDIDRTAGGHGGATTQYRLQK